MQPVQQTVVTVVKSYNRQAFLLCVSLGWMACSGGNKVEDSGEIEERVEKISVYIHQLAMDKHGDLYAASVYPEHAGEKRGREGPSHRRWTRDP